MDSGIPSVEKTKIADVLVIAGFLLYSMLKPIISGSSRF